MAERLIYEDIDKRIFVVEEATEDTPQVERYEPATDTPEKAAKAIIEDRLRADLAAIDTITDTALLSVTGTTVAEVRNSAQTAIRDLQRQVKDMARMNKRLIRQALRAYDSAD